MTQIDSYPSGDPADHAFAAEPVVETDLVEADPVAADDVAADVVVDDVSADVVAADVVDADADLGNAELVDLVEEEAAEPPKPESPYDRPGRWYVVHTYAGYENKVRSNLA